MSATGTQGFLPYERLEPTLTGWLAGSYGDAAAGLVCDVEGEMC